MAKRDFGQDRLAEIPDTPAGAILTTWLAGKLTPQPYAIATDEEHKVVVHFLKDGVLREQTVDPTKIVVVELDVDPAQPRYLQRGLGLGELICEDRKDR